MKDGLFLNIVDEQGNVIGKESRVNIHKKGLLHQEVHIWLFTPKGEILFQHRSKTKDTYPDLLDVSIGGHVEMGGTYESNAIKEAKEETGLTIQPHELIFLRVFRNNTHDPVTDRTNNAIQVEYGFRFDGKIEDLKIERGKSVGFEAWPIDRLLHATPFEKRRFHPSTFDPSTLSTLKFLVEFFIGPAPKHVKRRSSAGGVVLNPQGNVLVVNQNGDSWSLPKGGIEAGESPLDAACREILEESGVRELTLVREIGRFTRTRIAKGGGEIPDFLMDLTFFLFTTPETNLKPIDPQNPEARWVHKSEVAPLLTHPKDKEFFISILPSL